MIQRKLNRLADICAIQVGYTTRSRLEPVQENGTLALQLRDVLADGDVRLDTLMRVQLVDVAERYLVGEGDIIFRSRGERTTATVMGTSNKETIVAILPLIILRTNNKVALPDFVAWWINLPASQRHLDLASQGGSVRMVPKSALDDLPIDVPDLTTQQRIVYAASLARREAMLSASLAEKHQTLTTLALADAAKRACESRSSERSKL